MTSLVAEVLADSPVLYYPLDQPGGTSVLDLSGNARHGTASGGSWVGDAYAPSGHAFSLDGVTNWVSTPYSTAHTAAVTLECWCCPDTQTDAAPVLISKNSYFATDVNDFPISLQALSAGANKFTATLDAGGDFSANASVTAPDTWVVGRWYHVVLAFANGTTRLYVDGVEVASVATAFNLVGGSRAWGIGRTSFENGGGAGATNFKGKLAHVAVYPSQLSAARVAAHYAAARGATSAPDSYADLVLATPGIIGLWPLSEASGTAMDDVVATANGTLTGTPAAYQASGPGRGLPLALDLSGDDYVTVAEHTGMNVTEAISVEAWVRPDVLGGVVMARRTDANYNWELAVGSSGELLARIASNSNSATSATGLIVVGRWYHVVFTYDRVTIRAYLDGVQVATFAYSTAIPTLSANLLLGRRGMANPNEAFTDGRLAACALYRRSLSASEVRVHYLGGIAGVPNGLAVY